MHILRKVAFNSPELLAQIHVVFGLLVPIKMSEDFDGCCWVVLLQKLEPLIQCLLSSLIELLPQGRAILISRYIQV